MSLINLGLQCVGLMQKEGSSEIEKAIKNAHNLNAVQEATKQSYRNEVRSTLQPPLQLLTSITNRLELKGELFSVFKGASDDEIEAFWEVVRLIDDSLDQSDTSKSTLQKKPKLQTFLITAVKSVTILSA